MNRHDLEALQQAQNRAAELAADILAGRRGLLQAAHELKNRLWDAGLTDADPDVGAFVLIDSETDALPLGSERQYWELTALARKDKHIARAEAWARPFGLEACERNVRRFGPGTKR